jgi:rare lipoprotein A
MERMKLNIINSLYNISGNIKNTFTLALLLLFAACSTTKIDPIPAPGAPPTATMPPVTSVPPVITSQPSTTMPSAPPVVTPATPPQTGTTPGTPGGYYQDDGPGPNPPPNLEATPDPVPQAEPPHKYANEPYTALGQNFVPDKTARAYSASGSASWYGRQFHGKKTASGETYNMYGMSAAHPTLPIPSYARVTNLRNNKSVIVRVNDRGPFHANRVIDLSYTAALKLGYVQQGSTDVFVESINPQDAGNRNGMPASAVTTTRAPAPAPAPGTIISTGPATLPSAQPAAPVLNRPATMSSPAASVQAALGRPGYLQLGVFSNLANADSFREKMKKDLAWLTDPMEIFIIDKLYRVRVGPYSDFTKSTAVSGRVKSSLGFAPVWSPLQ